MGSGMSDSLQLELRLRLISAWLAGFAASGEGSNGEYPDELPGRPDKADVSDDLWARAVNYASESLGP